MQYQTAILVNPPNPPGYVSNKDSMGGFGQLYPQGAPPFPPLDLAYLAAFLIQEGREVQVIEAGALHLDVDEVAQRISEGARGSGALVMVRTSLPTIDWDLQVCADLRERYPDLRIGLYGPPVAHLLPRIEQEGAVDFVVIGEPDQTVADLMGDRPHGDIAGLAWRDDGRLRRNAERPPATDLDALPLPRWDLLPHDRYVIPRSATSGRLRFLPLLSSRGCPFGCNYCPYPVGQGLRWRFRSPENVVDEMEHLVRDLGVEFILFRDPMFSLHQERVVAICQEILRRSLKIQWRCETRVDCLDAETIAIMAEAGCNGINFGVESTDPAIQKAVHRKPILVEEFVEKVAICRRHGIKTFAFFIVGLPGDTVETILETISFAVDMRANWTQFTVATPFIGTELHSWSAERGLIAPDAYKIVSSHVGSVGNENLSPQDVTRLHRFARFLQQNLINRRGVLKNENRHDLPYRVVRGTLDSVTQATAKALVWGGRWYFRRRLPARGPRGAPSAP